MKAESVPDGSDNKATSAVERSKPDTIMNLELEISVRLSGLQLTIDEVLSLSEGQSLAYRFDPQAPVVLEVDSQAIAQASFEKKEGITALRIDRLFGSSCPERDTETEG